MKPPSSPPALPKSPRPHPPVAAARSSAPIPAPRPILGVCPDCGQTSTLAEMLHCALTRAVIMCPRCDVGSCATAWHAP